MGRKSEDARSVSLPANDKLRLSRGPFNERSGPSPRQLLEGSPTLKESQGKEVRVGEHLYI